MVIYVKNIELSAIWEIQCHPIVQGLELCLLRCCMSALQTCPILGPTLGKLRKQKPSSSSSSLFCSRPFINLSCGRCDSGMGRGQGHLVQAWFYLPSPPPVETRLAARFTICCYCISYKTKSAISFCCLITRLGEF